MKVGFKTGPQNWREGQEIVTEEGAAMCEIWFRVDQAEEYQPMLEWLEKEEVDVGLHYWGLVGQKYKPNLMTNNSAIREDTRQQIKETIRIAAARGSVYVNIHPGAQSLEQINFQEGRQQLVEKSKTPTKDAEQLLMESVAELQAWAEEQGVLLTIETLPGRENTERERGGEVYDPNNPSLSLMQTLAANNFWLANDFTHTAGAAAKETEGREKIAQAVREFTQATAEKTRLLHVNTVAEPFDGTDSHDGILYQELSCQIYPREEELRELLQIFKERSDVFAVPEPREKMRENYVELRRLSKLIEYEV
jgi:hypothetical protein